MRTGVEVTGRMAGQAGDEAPRRVPDRRSGEAVSVIIPFHRRLAQLERSLAAVRMSMPAAEVLIAADGAVEDCRALAATHGARVVTIDAGPRGPAVARNRAAADASGDILVFVDTDVVVAPDAIPCLCSFLGARPEMAAVFGAYDEQPADPGFMSRYKNLSHSYIHQQARGEALTFWAGLGAVRTAPFRSVGGFNAGIRRPSVEDIELGYRLAEAGHRLGVEPAARGCHLKRWTLWGSIVTDVRDRGIPWTQLILRHQALANDLNTTGALRWSVVLSYGVVFAALAAPFAPIFAAAAGLAALAGLLAVNLDYYRWFRRREGSWFAVRVFGAHTLHHLGNGVSFVAGAAIHAADRLGLHLPGRVPRAGPSVAAGDPAAVARRT